MAEAPQPVAVTREIFFDGELVVSQPRRGYRFSIDPVLLAHFVRPEPGDSVLDLGTGCGIIPLLLARRHTDISVTGLEIQPELADVAAENVRQNRLEGRVGIVQGDMKEASRLLSPASCDLVVTNPPYTRKGSGRLNPRSQKAIARHELAVTLDGVLAAGALALKPGGTLALVYPALRLAELMHGMRQRGLEPKRLRMVHPRREGGARLLLVEGVKNGRPGLEIDPPLVIYHTGNRYTREVEKMFEKD